MGRPKPFNCKKTNTKNVKKRADYLVYRGWEGDGVYEEISKIDNSP